MYSIITGYVARMTHLGNTLEENIPPGQERHQQKSELCIKKDNKKMTKNKYIFFRSILIK